MAYSVDAKPLVVGAQLVNTSSSLAPQLPVKTGFFHLTLIDNLLHTIAGKEAAHIVKMGFTTINKLGLVTLSFQDGRKRSEMLLAVG